MDCSKMLYMLPELIELDVPGSVVAGESGRNVDSGALDDKWNKYDDDSDDLIPEDADE